MPPHDTVTATATATASDTSPLEAVAAHADRRLLIDGRLVTTDRTFPSVNPANGDVIGHAPDAGTDEAAAAIAAARRPFDTTSWSTDVALRVLSIYGLAGAVFSADQDRALAVARRIRAGSFSVNGGNYFSADAPFGGFKQSGVGREMGVAGLEEFLERKTFAIPAVPADGAA